MALNELLFFQNNLSVEEISWRIFDRSSSLMERAQKALTDLNEKLPFWTAHLASYKTFSTFLEGKLATKERIASYGQLFYLDEGNGTFLTHEKKYELKLGSMVLVPAGIPHQILIPNYGLLMVAVENFEKKEDDNYQLTNYKKDPSSL